MKFSQLTDALNHIDDKYISDAAANADEAPQKSKVYYPEKRRKTPFFAAAAGVCAAAAAGFVVLKTGALNGEVAPSHSGAVILPSASENANSTFSSMVSEITSSNVSEPEISDVGDKLPAVCLYDSKDDGGTAEVPNLGVIVCYGKNYFGFSRDHRVNVLADGNVKAVYLQSLNKDASYEMIAEIEFFENVRSVAAYDVRNNKLYICDVLPADSTLELDGERLFIRTNGEQQPLALDMFREVPEHWLRCNGLFYRALTQNRPKTVESFLAETEVLKNEFPDTAINGVHFYVSETDNTETDNTEVESGPLTDGMVIHVDYGEMGYYARYVVNSADL